MADKQDNTATPVARGTLYKFLPLPPIEDFLTWFPAGPVAFGLEVRIIPAMDGSGVDRNVSLHVFDGERREEHLRFDCFATFAHYHYVRNASRDMVIWGYDTDAHGPMLDWTLNVLRTRLPAMLRAAGAIDLARRVETEGVDYSVLDQIEPSIAGWQPIPEDEMLERTKAWAAHWKEVHPEFNTAG